MSTQERKEQQSSCGCEAPAGADDDGGELWRSTSSSSSVLWAVLTCLRNLSQFARILVHEIDLER